MKIKLHNFQQISDAELEFPVGITVIQGPNGSGKSTIFRAINAIVTNPSGCSYYIKHGEQECAVTLQYNDQDITWIRTQSSSTYVNNKTKDKYLKSSKLDLFSVSDGMGFYLDPKGRVLNIHGTWSVLFPYGETDTELFKLFEDMFDISCSTSILSEIKNDEQQAKMHIKEEEAHLYEVNTTLNSLQTSLSKINEQEIKDIIRFTESLKLRLEEVTSDYELYKSNYVYCNIVINDTVIDFNDIDSLNIRLLDILKDYSEYISNNAYTSIEIPEFDESIINIEPIDVLLQDYNSYISILKYIESIDIQLIELDNQLNEIQGKINNIKVCPTCGRPF